MLSADVLDLLLQHGGNPNIELPDGPFFKELDFRVIFDVVELHDRRVYSSLVHFWMVAVSNGARNSSDKSKLVFIKEYDSDTLFDPGKLRNHRNYSFCLTHLSKDFAIGIYNRDTPLGSGEVGLEALLSTLIAPHFLQKTAKLY